MLLAALQDLLQVALEEPSTMLWKQPRNICHLRYSSALPRLICAVCLHSVNDWSAACACLCSVCHAMLDTLCHECWLQVFPHAQKVSTFNRLFCESFCEQENRLECAYCLSMRRDLKPTCASVPVQGCRKVAANNAVHFRQSHS